jgi:hypothetical protein
VTSSPVGAASPCLSMTQEFRASTRTFGAFTVDLLALRDWLLARRDAEATPKSPHFRPSPILSLAPRSRPDPHAPK